MNYLVLALDAEESKQWLESHMLCEKALVESPEDPDALNLLGRLCGLAGDAARAIALQSFVLHLVPGHARAGADLVVARGAVTSASEAARLFGEAVEIEPDIACHRRHFLSLFPFVGMERVESLLRQALFLDPSNANVHAALGNILTRRQEWLAAIDAYGLASMLRWDLSDVHLMLADLLDWVREAAPARSHREAALLQRRLFTAGATSVNAVRRILVLAAPGGAVQNSPFDLVVNPARTALHRYYFVDGEPLPAEWPPYDAVFNGIEELEASAPAIERATEFAHTSIVSVINDPGNLRNTRRSNLPKVLAGIAGCEVPPAVRLERERLEGIANTDMAVGGVPFPLLIRPVDTHRGEGLVRTASARELGEYLHKDAGRAYNLTGFVDYRSPDGYYRKYRAIVVDGMPYPYHLAISDRWMVHYAGSFMEEQLWMRSEEEHFLANPASVFERWNEAFAQIAKALGLDYFGVDFARSASGKILVFECGVGMLVHCHDDPEIFPYKYRYVPRIFDAVEHMLDDRASRGSEPEG